MVEITYQMVLSTIQTVGILVGIIYYIANMRNQNRSRQIQIMGSTTKMDLTYDFLNWDTEDYDVFMSEHGSKADPEGWKALNVWFNSLELRGLYVREGLLDVRLVCLMSGGTIKESWESYRGIWEEWRHRYNRPRYYIEVEYLYERVVEYLAGHPELGL
jgi:hypothetical protein